VRLRLRLGATGNRSIVKRRRLGHDLDCVG
jgi:hypothetical protein